jgi:GT2 family glycosyltransferase
MRTIKNNDTRYDAAARLQGRIAKDIRLGLGQGEAGQPAERILEAPNWFNTSPTCDISIIVPMFKSRYCIQEQIAKWDTNHHGLLTEIIYVDDLCPQKSHEVILRAWERKLNSIVRPIGKIITSNYRRGYAGACNLGAKHAIGNYLVFLNADVVVEPNWLRPLYDLCVSDPTIGIVGSLILSKNGEAIDSAGSEWSGGTFQHIGRDVYNGESLTTPMSAKALPNDLSRPCERSMMTGCCFMTPKTLFHEIGGYDEAYKIGYWEDSDMNMKVHEKQRKVLFQPNSRVLHLGGHSGGVQHKYMSQNQQLFYERWVNTGFVAKLIEQIRERNGKISSKEN